VCLFVCFVPNFELCWTYLEIAGEGAHVLAQCASYLCRSTAAQYIKIRDGTTIPYIKRGATIAILHCVEQYRINIHI